MTTPALPAGAVEAAVGKAAMALRQTITNHGCTIPVAVAREAAEAARPFLAGERHEHTWKPCPNCPNPGQPCACAGAPCCDAERRENDAGYEPFVAGPGWSETEIRVVPESAVAEAVAAERERLKQLLGEHFKEVLAQPSNGYLVDAVAWSHLLDVLGPGADLLRQGGEGGGG